MNIGGKIRSLRVAKLMTQAELAGNQITRNMLSCIENGAAQPSLSTILYIAERLGVPVGFLLAEEGDEIVYVKMGELANIKRAYRARDWQGCRSLCQSLGTEPDDEIRMLLAECDLGIAIDSFWAGKVRAACRFFDEALLYAKETIYSLPHVRAQAEVYFRYMQRLSPTLYSDALDENEPTETVCKNAFSAYVDALDAVDAGDNRSVGEYHEMYAEEAPVFAEHLAARGAIIQERYSEAKVILTELLGRGTGLNEIILYSLLRDLEICCRETGDFEGAYRYTNEKVQQLEKLLKDY
jgi:transcriptional regulator with XRE-family HTH domain